MRKLIKNELTLEYFENEKLIWSCSNDFTNNNFAELNEQTIQVCFDLKCQEFDLDSSGNEAQPQPQQ